MPDVDWGQVIFLILVVVVGFIRWVANLIEQQKEAKRRANMTPEEVAARETAWRREMGYDDEEQAQELDPFEELKEMFERARQEQERESAPPQPPPLPPARAPAPSVLRAPAPPPLAPPPLVAAAVTAAFPTATRQPREAKQAKQARQARMAAPAGSRFQPRTSHRLASLRQDLASANALRQAVLFHEVLGPPLALREEQPSRAFYR